MRFHMFFWPLCALALVRSFLNQIHYGGGGHEAVESVQGFLIKLDIKPLMHLLEISTFSLNNVFGRLTKIMNRADKNLAHF